MVLDPRPELPEIGLLTSRNRTKLSYRALVEMIGMFGDA